VAIPILLVGSQTVFGLYGPELPGSAVLIVGIQDLGLGVLAVVLVLWLLKIDRRAIGLTLGERRTTLVRTAVQVLILAGLTLLYTGLIVVLARTNRVKIPIEPTSLTDFREAWIFVIVAGLVGPLYEEVLFRGMLTSALDWPGKRWLTVLGSAVLFALPHWAPGIHVLRLLGPLITGLLLGWSYLRTRSVLTPFAVHAMFNSGVIVKDILMQYHPGLVRRILGYE
jgi:membrane protease YdiL (CAAX protease family)